MIFVIKKNYNPNKLLNFLDRLTEAQHQNFWEFFTAFRIYAEIDGKEVIVRKNATRIYSFALIKMKKGQWVGVSCSNDRHYLEKESQYYTETETRIVPVKVGLIVKRDYQSLTQINLGV